MTTNNKSLNDREKELIDPEEFEHEFGGQFSDDKEVDFYNKLIDKAEEFRGTNTGEFLAYSARSSSSALAHGGGKVGWTRGLWAGLSRKSKGKLILLAIGPSILVTVLVVLFILMTGPLQFVHAAQILEKYHFGAVNSFIDNRTSRILRYYGWKDKPQNRRLTLTGNAIADIIDARYKQMGMEIDFNEKGNLKGIDVDTKKFPASELEKIRSEFTVGDIDARGHVYISAPDNFSGRQRRILFQQTRDGLGLGGFGGYLMGRLTANRISPSMFHPLRKLDGIILDNVADARAKWRERKNSIIETGDPPKVRGSPDSTDEDGNTKTNVSDDIATSVDDVSNVDPELQGEPKVKAVKSKFKTGLAGAGAVNMVTGVICLVYTLADVADEFEYSNIAEPSMRTGGRQIGLGNQAKNQVDVDATQLGFEAEYMYDESDDGDPDTHPSSFFDAKSFQIASGKEPTGPDIPSSAKIGGSKNVLSQITGLVPESGQWLLSGGCGLVSSPVGQLFTFSIDAFLAPASAVAGFGASLLTGPLLNELAKYLAGEQISNDLAGAPLGAVADQGAFFLSNQQCISGGCQALSNTDRIVLQENIKDEQRELQNQSSFERYFAVENAYSLFGNIARNRVPSFGNIFSSVINLPSVFAKSSKILTSVAHAAPEEVYDYGIPKFGYTPNELSLMDNDESYANPFENAKQIETKIPEMHKQYGEKCFGVKFDDKEHFQVTKILNMKKLTEDPENSDCRRTDSEFLRYRLYVADLINIVSLACWEGDDASCREIGFRS